MLKNVNQRLETFCDGVFAIAITLLILEIKVPHIHEGSTAHDLWHELAQAWPSWFAFILTFTSILIAWVNHHNFFKYLDKSSHLFLYVNGFFLFTVAVMPFPTALMADYLNTAHARTAIIVYSFSALLHNIAWVALFWVSLKPKFLLKKEVSLEKYMKGIKNTYYGFFIYTAITVLAFWFPIAAVVLITLSWVAWVVIGVVFDEDEL